MPGWISSQIRGTARLRWAHNVVADTAREAMPRLWLTLSSECCPEIREYERTSTACANAYVQPLMAGYIERLEALLVKAGFTGALYLMTSGGGLAAADVARDRGFAALATQIGDQG